MYYKKCIEIRKFQQINHKTTYYNKNNKNQYFNENKHKNKQNYAIIKFKKTLQCTSTRQ